jgi:hypothetical protein
MSTSTKFNKKPASATTEVDLPNDLVLKVTTSKTIAGLLCTRVAVHKVEGNFCVFKPFSDFSVTLATASLRATDVNVRRQHQAVLADLPELVKCATVHYQVRRADSPPSVAVTAA